ncbi:cell division protein FtsZ [Sphingomonas jeddahensis]|uniref:Cell division protein FtsZ n=1 Tax=Sphingomonas jeddahensis TaxID=1915074 RepID=A0A1V2EXC2_9SPHN|nr:cell division protein FtsZ [Sphingomonas jeddahensis]ONF97250.1 Cell division protein FtsZ [Sphingomonas jeddahensis]
MGIEFIAPEVDDLTPKIAVIGVGGAGGNAIANMMRADVQGVDFLVANTDAQALKQSIAPQKIQLGAKITQGLGAGSRPEIGRAAAEETIEQVSKLLEGAHMCFIAAGMGGGTGTGAAPVIAKAARDMGILTVGVVTKPFAFEGKRRGKSADQGIEELQKFVDTLIVIPNQNLFLIANANTTFKQAFELADEVLQQGVRGITDLMVMPGLINLDFADVRSVMQEMGKAMMGTGEADGDDRALVAAQKAIANPLLDGVSMQGAKGVIISITGGEDMRLLEVDEAANHIRELVDPEANIIWGSAFNPDLEGKIRVSVVATGIEAVAPSEAPQAEPARAFSFSAPRRIDTPAPTPAPTPAAAAPAAPAPQPTGAAAGAMSAGVPAPGAKPEVELTPAARAVEEAAGDELLLGSDTVVPPTSAAPQQAAPQQSAQPRVFGDDDTGGAPRRRWLSGGGEAAEDVPAQPRVKLGGTLFERMQNASRGAPRGEEEEGKDALDIPRFLHRQNNQ